MDCHARHEPQRLIQGPFPSLPIVASYDVAAQHNGARPCINPLMGRERVWHKQDRSNNMKTYLSQHFQGTPLSHCNLKALLLTHKERVMSDICLQPKQTTDTRYGQKTDHLHQLVYITFRQPLC